MDLQRGNETHFKLPNDLKVFIKYLAQIESLGVFAPTNNETISVTTRLTNVVPTHRTAQKKCVK